MIKQNDFVSCIVAAGGSGARMGAQKNKLFLPIGDKPVIAHTLLALQKSSCIHEIILSAREVDMAELKRVAEKYGITKLAAIVRGGAHRAASVKSALSAVSEWADVVAVHDGARPLIADKQIQEVVAEALKSGAAAVGVPPKCTLKRADVNGFITETVDRSMIFEIQTPQVFQTSILQRAYDADETVLKCATDDCFLVERLGVRIRVVEGSYRNIKVTTPEDMILAERLLEGEI